MQVSKRTGFRVYGLLTYVLLQFLQGNFLDDIHKLHLPTLTWRQPPRVHGRPARALRNIAGHSIEGLIAFGGCISTIMGIMPVAKTDPLLTGEHTRSHLFSCLSRRVCLLIAYSTI